MAIDFGDDLVLIRYHGWWPSSGDPYYQYNIPQNTARINYYGADYSPHLWIDGTVDGQSNRNSWENQINAELNVSAPIDLDIRGSYNPANRATNIVVTIFATDPIEYSNLKLRIAATESRIAWQAPNGSYWHNQTFRNMYPSTSGFAFAIGEGQSIQYETGFMLNSAINTSNCEIVAFVQSDAGHRILQGAKIGVSELAPAQTLLPFSLLLPPDGAVIDTCYPEFVWNSTVEPGSSDPINYSVYLSQDPSFPNPIISTPSPDTTWTSEICLVPDIAYYWKVLASNGSAPDRFSEELFSVTVHPPDTVPTLSEWGIFILSLLFIAVGTGGIISRKSANPAPERRVGL